MKVAFIPPKGLTSYAERGDILMCLAQLIDNPKDPDYTDVMRKLSVDKFTLLDNGANEGSPMTDEALANASTRLHVGEIVLPDALGDMEGTLTASRRYLKQHCIPGFRYIGVVQGSTTSELMNIIAAYDKMMAITTLGLPRLLLKRIGKSTRIDMANWIEAKYHKRFEIHFLGACTSWIKEPFFVNRYASHVRSIDTSLPFNYGLMGKVIQDYVGVTHEKIERRQNYFEQLHEANSHTTIDHNMRIYKEWCNGKKTPSS